MCVIMDHLLYVYRPVARGVMLFSVRDVLFFAWVCAQGMCTKGLRHIPYISFFSLLA